METRRDDVPSGVNFVVAVQAEALSFDDQTLTHVRVEHEHLHDPSARRPADGVPETGHRYGAVMAIPHVVARFNKRVTNRFIEPIARRSSGFAVVHHVGRRTGTEYRTPVVRFDLDGDTVVVLTYGTQADWFRNALAGAASLETARCTSTIRSIERVGRDIARPALPRFVRAALRVMTVRDFARMSLAEQQV